MIFPVLAMAAALHVNPLLVCGVAGEAERRGIDPYIVCALVQHESQWRVWAKSTTEDYGLMQIHEPVHGRHRSPAANIKKGVDILSRDLAREHGDVRRALSRYNTGRVTRRGLAYADKVLRIAARLRRQIEGGKRWQHERCSLRLSRSLCWYSSAFMPCALPRRRGGARRAA